jgi:hypothetical protein
MLRVIKLRMLNVDEELCTCFIHWQKVVHSLMDQTGTDCKGTW